MFIFYLDKHARKWFRSLPIASIHSLKDFHMDFSSHYEKIYLVEILFEECCEKFKSYIQQIIDCSSYDELCKDLDEKEIKNGSECFNKNMDETLSLSISREEGFQDMVDDSIDDCIVVDELYLVSDAPNILNLKDEIVVE